MLTRFSHRLVAVGAAGIAVAALTACGSSGSKAAAPTTAGPTTTTTAAPTTSTTLDLAALKAEAQNALLKASDVGTGFTDATYSAGDPKQPLPCGQPNVSATYPSVLKVGAEVDKAQDLALIEELEFYADDATAKAAVALGSAGLNCTTGSIPGPNGTPVSVTLTGPQDVTSQVGGDQASAWQVKADAFTGVLIEIQYKNSITAFSFLAVAGHDTSADPKPLDVAKKGEDKIKAAP